MVTLRETNPSTNCARFAISTAADIADLPTMTAAGTAGNGISGKHRRRFLITGLVIRPF